MGLLAAGNWLLDMVDTDNGGSMTIQTPPMRPPVAARSSRQTNGLQRLASALLATALLAASTLIFSPAAIAVTDDYPVQWRNVPRDSMFDTWREYNRECTSFVAWRLHSRNGFEMLFHNDASGWGQDARARGYTVDMNPAVGAVAWSSNHVAWVESVNRGGTVTIEEYNLGSDGAYHERTIAAGAVLGYIHFKDIAGRLSGPDRFATSAAISAASFDPGVPVVYVANALDFPDALSGAAVAGKNGAPVLLVPSDGIPAVIQAELTRLKPKSIVVLGGESVVSLATETALAASTAGSVTRISGADRFATSAAISFKSFDPGVPVVYIANGLNFPDALSGAPVAGKNDAPVLLVPPDGIPDPIRDELTRLRPGRVVVLGGESVVSRATETALHLLTMAPVTRLSGPDRFATSAAISAINFDPGVPVVYIANGLNFPDALSGAPVAGKNGSPVLLVPPDSIPPVIQAELSRLRPARIVVLGGESVVSGSVLQQLGRFLVPPT